MKRDVLKIQQNDSNTRLRIITKIRVKILYVRNLMLTTTEETILKEFNQMKDGCVERVKKLRDFAFVHFFKREDAIKAMDVMDGASIEGSIIEVVLAKPVDKNQYIRFTRGAGRGYVQPGYPYEQQGPPQMGPGPYATGPYGAAGYAPQYPQYPAASSVPSMAGRGFIPRPGPPPPMGGGMGGMRGGRGRGAGGVRGAGGMRGYGRGSYGRGYQKATEVLEDLCLKNSWGTPVFHLLSSRGPNDVQLFVYRVTVPALANFPNGLQPSKLCSNVEDAKVFAAEFVLGQLGVTMDGGDDSSPTVPPTSTIVTPPMASPTVTSYMSSPSSSPEIIQAPSSPVVTVYQQQPTTYVQVPITTAQSPMVLPGPIVTQGGDAGPENSPAYYQYAQGYQEGAVYHQQPY